MSKVYYKPIDSYSKTAEISAAAKELFEKVNSEEKLIEYTQPVPLKVHFGEEKNVTFIEPKNFEGLIDYLKEKKANPFFIETNVLYKGSRTTRESHITLAKEHGFTAIPIVIADGEMGENYEEVDISSNNSKHFKKCKVGKEIADAKQLVVLAHVKGHMLAGFGGAIKQLGMGCAARGGKLDMHAHSKPFINPLKCKKCMTCVGNCPAGALVIDGPLPHIDYVKCIGCAKCIAVCPHDAVQVNWLATGKKEFTEKLAEYAFAAQKGKKVIYINFVLNVTKECDCMGKKYKPIAKDIGVLASSDPVAIDKASLDLLQKVQGKKVFGASNTFEHAQALGLGKEEYELIEL